MLAFITDSSFWWSAPPEAGVLKDPSIVCSKWKDSFVVWGVFLA